MSRHEAAEISVRTLLDAGKEVPRQPDAVRARVLGRASAIAASPASALTPELGPHRSFPHPFVAAAAAAALAVGVAGTVFALNGWWRPKAAARVDPPVAVTNHAPPPPVAKPGSPGVVAQPTPPMAPPSAETTTASTSNRESSRERRASTVQASYAAELELMHSAHTAYAAHDYANALVLTGEHARRFPGGVLAEEREALRVRCLLGSGRTSEARRTVAAFAKRFPRSVLLERLKSELEPSTD